MDGHMKHSPWARTPEKDAKLEAETKQAARAIVEAAMPLISQVADAASELNEEMAALLNRHGIKVTVGNRLVVLGMAIADTEDVSAGSAAADGTSPSVQEAQSTMRAATAACIDTARQANALWNVADKVFARRIQELCPERPNA